MAIESKPNEALGYNNLGFLLLYVGNNDGAYSNLIKCIGIDETHPRAHYNLGAYYFAKGNDGEGIKEYERAIVLDTTELSEHLSDLTKMKNDHRDWTWVDRALTYLVDVTAPAHEKKEVGEQDPISNPE